MEMGQNRGGGGSAAGRMEVLMKITHKAVGPFIYPISLCWTRGPAQG